MGHTSIGLNLWDTILHMMLHSGIDHKFCHYRDTFCWCNILYEVFPNQICLEFKIWKLINSCVVTWATRGTLPKNRQKSKQKIPVTVKNCINPLPSSLRQYFWCALVCTCSWIFHVRVGLNSIHPVSESNLIALKNNFEINFREGTRVYYSPNTILDDNKFDSLHWCWWRILETECVGEKF